MKAIRYLFLFFLQLLYLFVFSQRQSIKFEHLDINAGLSQNHIMCILQDSRGFMWLGTRDGLNKYDGYKFTVYKNAAKDEHSISNNFISAILEDSKGIIWVATRGGGLNRYDKEKDQFTSFKNDPDNPNSISSDLLSSLAEDDGGNLWIATEDGGINYFEPGKNIFIHYKHKPNDNKSLSDDNTRYIFTDSEQNVWVGSYNGGLNLFTKKTKIFTQFKHDDKNKASLSNDNVRVIFEDSKHRLWVGTVGGGLDLFDKMTGSFLHFTHNINSQTGILSNVVAALGEDHDGNIWIGTENGGLSIYNAVTGTFQNYLHDEIDHTSISNNSIYSIYKDAHDNMWVGTFSGGLNILNKDVNKFAHYKHSSSANSLSDNKVLCLAENRNGKIWIGTDGGGLNLFDPGTKNFTHFVHEEKNKNSICGNYILSVCEDSKGHVWIGTWADGITVFNKEKNTFAHFKNSPGDPSTLSNNNAWVIFEDRDKNIWVGTYGGGLNLYNPGNNSFTRFDDSTVSIPIKQTYSITEDKKGNLWIGTDGGGVRIFNKSTRTFTRLIHQENKNSLSDNRINYIYEDGQDNFWINTMSGLNYFDTKKQEFTIYTTADGLPNNVIFGILEDESHDLWISTNGGLSRFDPKAKKFKNFTPADGLQSYEFKAHSLYKARSGAMYFGGINGFNEFYPANIKESAFEPPLVLTGFQLFNKKILIAKNDSDPSPLKKDISETNAITLPYRSSAISFEFASLNYTVAEKKQYAYMLEGFDKSWNETGTSRVATYTNLDPGQYIFKVRGLNNEGNWSSRTISLPLTITPPFWMTWWFKLGVLITIAGGTFMFFKFRMMSINTQKIKLQQQVHEKTWQLVRSAEEEHKARQEAEAARFETELANKELELKNKELEQFAYVASHDLQEPLRTTSSFAELLQQQYKGKLDENADKYLSFITQSSDRMKVLIKDLLDYSRIGRKQEWEQVDCNIMLQEVMADLEVAIKETNAEIKAGSLPVIRGYSTEIKLLFQNLLINAVKFRKKDTPPQITIAAQKTKSNWEFTFSDNGIGMDEQHKERIFIIFQRLHTRTEYEGSGIGLAHCKKIVGLHGGKIWVESVPGEGATFHFTIPTNNR